MLPLCQRHKKKKQLLRLQLVINFIIDLFDKDLLFGFIIVLTIVKIKYPRLNHQVTFPPMRKANTQTRLI